MSSSTPKRVMSATWQMKNSGAETNRCIFTMMQLLSARQKHGSAPSSSAIFRLRRTRLIACHSILPEQTSIRWTVRLTKRQRPVWHWCRVRRTPICLCSQPTAHRLLTTCLISRRMTKDSVSIPWCSSMPIRQFSRSITRIIPAMLQTNWHRNSSLRSTCSTREISGLTMWR